MEGLAVSEWQGLKTRDCLQARSRSCDSLLDEVLSEEALMVVVFMEVPRRQNRRQNGSIRFHLDTHQAVDDCGSHELMAVDAAIDHEAAGNDGVVLPCS